MGWNDLTFSRPVHPLLAGIAPGAHAYFVHSYGFRPHDPATVLATVDYGGAGRRGRSAATIWSERSSIPEKSQATGLRLIGNFLRWRP